MLAENFLLLVVLGALVAAYTSFGVTGLLVAAAIGTAALSATGG